MLVLSRRPGERIRLRVNGVTIWVAIADVDRNKVRLAFDAPPEVLIEREEIIGKPKEPGK